ncbi:MAG: hypothetical protein AVDCRST_MAG14-1130 [uncultured Rubrobacteraceae bacterium]|uniref:Uncharacterized protein n=1 Tax=uncultured Rubrobacteraceae bacterium TaxID=349277 RepID=A0A6J4QWE9_9ACTN|nr:MAG: hypothetical protein AVDCRST_MAG14-1130 [uncultured Rubrobacteraceae bacterium]
MSVGTALVDTPRIRLTEGAGAGRYPHGLLEPVERPNGGQLLAEALSASGTPTVCSVS